MNISTLHKIGALSWWKAATKLTKIPEKLWEHKKKSAFGFTAAYFIGRKIHRWKRNCDILALYAHEAKRFGEVTLASDERLRRVTVLVDMTTSDAFENFRKNALPLLNLAGLQVELIKCTDRSEFEAVAEHIGTTECDALFIVGGDNSLSSALTAIYNRHGKSPVPVGVFPGGPENRSLIGLVPNVYAIQNDIRPYCESAMALIEEKTRPVYLSCVKFENSEGDESKKQFYGVAGLHAGWYDRVETNKLRKWYWGRLKRWMTYLTSTITCLKQYPKMELSILCEEYCTGCCRCRPGGSSSMNLGAKDRTNWRWWHYIIGSSHHSVSSTESQKDYSTIKNENCGKIWEVQVSAVDVTVENVQDQDACGIRVRTGGDGHSIINLLMDGWRRCQTMQLTTSPDTSFYQNDFLVRSAVLTFSQLPDAFKKMTILGKDYQLDDALRTKIILESTDKFVNIFLPSELRVS